MKVSSLAKYFSLKQHSHQSAVRLLPRRSFRTAGVLALLMTPFAAYALNSNSGAQPPVNNQTGHTEMNLEPKQPDVASESSVSSDIESHSSQSSISVDSSSSSRVSGGAARDTSKSSVSAQVDGSNASVIVNGKTIKLPSSGSVHKNITSPDGNTSIDVSIDGEATGAANSNNSSVNLQITSESSGSTDEAP